MANTDYNPFSSPPAGGLHKAVKTNKYLQLNGEERMKNAITNAVAAKFKTPQAIAEMNNDIQSCRIRVSKELKSLHPNREIIKIKVARISYLNHLIKYGYGVK